MNRIVTQTITIATGAGNSWRAPAGVTSITVWSRTATVTVNNYPAQVLTVVPNTNYTITVPDTTWDAPGDSATFGSLLTFPCGVRLLISWVE